MISRRNHRSIARALLLLTAVGSACLGAAQHAAAAPTFPGPYFFYDEFPVDGSAPDAAKWIENDAANQMNVSGGFLTVARTASDEYAETLTSELVYPPGVTTWAYETRVRVDNDGQEISNASLMVGANPGLGGRDLSIFVANGENPDTLVPDTAYFGIGVTNATPLVPFRSFIRGQDYTVTVVHNAAGGPSYNDDTLDVFVNGTLYSSYAAFPDGGGTFGPPPVVRLGSGAFQGRMDYLAVGQIPEPASAALLVAGLFAVAARRRA